MIGLLPVGHELVGEGVGNLGGFLGIGTDRRDADQVGIGVGGDADHLQQLVRRPVGLELVLCRLRDRLVLVDYRDGGVDGPRLVRVVHEELRSQEGCVEACALVHQAGGRPVEGRGGNRDVDGDGGDDHDRDEDHPEPFSQHTGVILEPSGLLVFWFDCSHDRLSGPKPLPTTHQRPV